jgi:membrane protease YdiL (CAAX protease family)
MPWDFWLILAALAVLVPLRGRKRMHELLSAEPFGRRERLWLYAATIAFQWTITVIVAWRALARGLSAADLGLSLPNRAALTTLALAGSLVFGALQWLNMRRMGRLPAEKRGILQPLAERILPTSVTETVSFLLLAATAGLCEEFLYRGFVIAVILRAGLGGAVAVLASALLFGLAHTYQGRGGFASTLLLGLVFGAVRLAYISLLPPVCWHFAVDAVAGFAGARFLLRRPALSE